MTSLESKNQVQNCFTTPYKAWGQGKDKSLKKAMWNMIGDLEEVRRDNKSLKILAMKSQPKNRKKKKLTRKEIKVWMFMIVQNHETTWL